MHDNLTDQTSDIVALADVERWNIIKTHRKQSVAEHSFLVAAIVMELGGRLGLSEDEMAVAVYWSLIHDVPEGYTGDVDGKFKREHPDVSAVLKDAEEKAFDWWSKNMNAVRLIRPCAYWVVKVADKMEALSFIQTHGYGSRAKDVESELRSILFNDVVPQAAAAIGVSVDKLTAMVRTGLYSSLSEENNIQLRRHRGATPPPAIPVAKYEPAPFVADQHVPGRDEWTGKPRMTLAEEGETD